MNEIWLPIPKYEGLYEASNLGNVRSVDRIVGGMGDHHLKGKPKSFCLSGPKSKKYYYVNLYKNCKGNLYSVHRIIATLFVPNPNHYGVVNHVDGNQLNNHFGNLEWCNFRENVSHAGRLKKSLPCGVQLTNGKRASRWTAMITIDRKSVYLGTYPTPQEASQAYKQAIVDNKLVNRYA